MSLESIFTRLSSSAMTTLPDLALGLLIALATWQVARWVRAAVVRGAARLGWDEIMWSYMASAMRWLIVAIGFTSALEKLGFPVDALLTTFGISGVIIGFGARGAIANYFAGVMMLGARPFKQGDLIEFGPPQQVGRVAEVRMTYTGLITLDNVRIVVPNAVMWRNKIINFSSFDTRAIRIPMGIPYDVDVDWVSDLALATLKNHAGVLDEPAPSFVVSDVTAEQVKAVLTAWSQVQTMNVFGDVITQMKREFETAGLDITLPTQDIDLKKEE